VQKLTQVLLAALLVAQVTKKKSPQHVAQHAAQATRKRSPQLVVQHAVQATSNRQP
jgi:hypothetical protein